MDANTILIKLLLKIDFTHIHRKLPKKLTVFFFVDRDLPFSPMFWKVFGVKIYCSFFFQVPRPWRSRVCPRIFSSRTHRKLEDKFARMQASAKLIKYEDTRFRKVHIFLEKREKKIFRDLGLFLPFFVWNKENRKAPKSKQIQIKFSLVCQLVGKGTKAIVLRRPFVLKKVRSGSLFSRKLKQNSRQKQ